MMKASSFFSWAVVIGGAGFAWFALLAGCATGSVDETEFDTFPVTPSEAGSGDEGSRLPPPSNPPSSDDGGNRNDAGTKDSGGGDAGGDGGGPVGCTAANACAGATDLGELSGDTGADTATFQGSTSQWFVVRLTEDNNDAFDPDTLEMKATLTSPPGTNFDLYIYNPSTGRECSALNTQSTSTGSSDTASLEFGETGLFANGSADDRNITVEVRYVSGPCNPSTKWTLTLVGNQM